MSATKKHSKKKKEEKTAKNLVNSKKHRTFAADFNEITKKQKVDPLAQSVEHNTFNVGVLGSSPKRITTRNPQEVEHQQLADFCFQQMRNICTTNRYTETPHRPLRVF